MNENFMLCQSGVTKLVGDNYLIEQWSLRHSAQRGESLISSVTTDDQYVEQNFMEFDDMQDYQADKRKRQRSVVTWTVAQGSGTDARSEAYKIDTIINSSNQDEVLRARQHLMRLGYTL